MFTKLVDCQNQGILGQEAALHWSLVLNAVRGIMSWVIIRQGAPSREFAGCGGSGVQVSTLAKSRGCHHFKAMCEGWLVVKARQAV